MDDPGLMSARTFGAHEHPADDAGSGHMWEERIVSVWRRSCLLCVINPVQHQYTS